MSNIREIVDAFLLKHQDFIESSRQSKDFKWSEILDLFKKETKQTSDSEYLRSRFRKLKAKNIISVTTTNPAQKFIYLSGKEDKLKGTSEFHFTADNIPSEKEVIEHFKIDTTKYRISQIWHKTTPSGKYSISVNLQALKGSETISIDDVFLEKLKQIKPLSLINVYTNQSATNKNKACLLIPKQDVHWNKYDIDGKNDINERFSTFTKSMLSQLEKVQATNEIEKIIYIVGSDEFNSEWTGTTTKGTQQVDILSYQESFERVTEFTIEFIKLLRYYSPNVEVVLLNGNHDHNVSWHLANLLKHVFSKNESISVDTDLVNTKILEYSTNLILVNHGDEMKPKDLATKFPIIAKAKWSSFDNYFVVTGDKHHETAHDFNGVRTFQVPQLSTAKSAWDDKKGHLCSKAELVTFLFEEDGLSNILRKQIK